MFTCQETILNKSIISEWLVTSEKFFLEWYNEGMNTPVDVVFHYFIIAIGTHYVHLSSPRDLNVKDEASSVSSVIVP